MTPLEVINEMAQAHVDNQVVDLVLDGKYDEAAQKYIENMQLKGANVPRSSSATTKKFRQDKYAKGLKADKEKIEQVSDEMWDEFDAAYKKQIEQSSESGGKTKKQATKELISAVEGTDISKIYGKAKEYYTIFATLLGVRTSERIAVEEGLAKSVRILKKNDPDIKDALTADEARYKEILDKLAEFLRKPESYYSQENLQKLDTDEMKETRDLIKEVKEIIKQHTKDYEKVKERAKRSGMAPVKHIAKQLEALRKEHQTLDKIWEGEEGIGSDNPSEENLNKMKEIASSFMENLKGMGKEEKGKLNIDKENLNNLRKFISFVDRKKGKELSEKDVEYIQSVYDFLYDTIDDNVEMWEKLQDKRKNEEVSFKLMNIAKELI
jgi:hypothetical protein